MKEIMIVKELRNFIIPNYIVGRIYKSLNKKQEEQKIIKFT